MIPRSLSGNQHGRDRGFVWRSSEVSRLEGLSDAVFAFAITLLVVSLEVPRTFTELYETMRGFLPFAISFAMLVQIWYSQFIWFRRYGLQDALTVTLNAVLLFVVLFYVYPLKFLFSYLVNEILGGQGMVRMSDGHMEPMLQGRDGYTMMLIYNAGFIAVFGVFVLLYLHAWTRRAQLNLNLNERLLTLERMGANVCMVSIGLLSMAVLTMGGPAAVSRSGLAYMLIGPALTVYLSITGRKRRLQLASQRVVSSSSSSV